MPRTAERIWSMLGLKGSVLEKIWDKELFEAVEFAVTRSEPLFHKLPQDFLERIDHIVEEARARAAAKRPKVIAD
jgi:methionyl-tRNA synthetase